MKAVILLSGGADSRFLLRKVIAGHGRESVAALFFDYGQLMPEAPAARRMALSEGITLIERKLPFSPPSHLTDGYFEGNAGTTREVPESWVPGRNLMMVSGALTLAEVYGADRVYVGFNRDDAEAYPDCSQHFIRNVNKLAKYNAGRPMEVRAPLLGMTKENIFTALEAMGISSDEYVSGYPGTRLAND
jgi:7-cyano-7-deazaguanine synthase